MSLPVLRFMTLATIVFWGSAVSSGGCLESTLSVLDRRSFRQELLKHTLKVCAAGPCTLQRHVLQDHGLVQRNPHLYKTDR